MLPLALALLAAPPGFSAGVAVRVITPAGPMAMTGYASRKAPAAGTTHELRAKALAVADDRGYALVLLTSDLIGLPADLADAVAADVMRRTGLRREQLMLTASHTHSGPVVRHNLADLAELPPAEVAKVDAYAVRLQRELADVMVAAFDARKPARLQVGDGTAGFAVNRRQPTAAGMTIGVNPDGPTDRRVPVLWVDAADGSPVAAAFGYACHNVTVEGDKWNGDYAGYAQLEVETAVPGAVALFWSGCAGDINPHPRRTLEAAERHGRELATAVAGTRTGATPVSGRFAARYATLPLPYDTLPTAETLRAELTHPTYAFRSRARRLLAELDAGPLPAAYPAYPVQAWRLGDGVVWAAVGGEAVVDYGLRLQRELAAPGRTVWATAYANDVMAYIPSERVLREGGYEADLSAVFYGRPARWAAGLEGRIVDAVVEQVRGLDAR